MIFSLYRNFINYGDDYLKAQVWLYANNVALLMAFDAWKTRSHSDRKGVNRNPVLQGLRDFTPEQLFFISYGNSICFRSDSSLLKFRINGAVANSEDFARAFGCAPNTTMNPVPKCDFFSKEPYNVPEDERENKSIYPSKYLKPVLPDPY
ncbi:unnamed protein product [Mortierella alpina]